MKKSYQIYTLSLAIVLGLLYLGSGVFTVDQDEVGVVLRFGVHNRTVGSGINYRFPWPFEQVYRVKTAAVYPMSIGYLIRNSYQGIAPVEAEMQWLTGDTNLINIRMEIQYRVNDPVQFLFRTEEPRFLVRKAAEAVLTEVVGKTPVDELLTRGKTALAIKMEEEVQKRLDQYQSGLMIVSRGVNIEALEPPEQVISYFHEVKSAEQEREKATFDAEGYRANRIFEARGEAEEILNQSNATYDSRIAATKADTQRFLDILEEYRANPEVIRDKLYYETLSKILPDLEITIIPGGETPPQIQIIRQR